MLTVRPTASCPVLGPASSLCACFLKAVKVPFPWEAAAGHAGRENPGSEGQQGQRVCEELGARRPGQQGSELGEGVNATVLSLGQE